MPAHESPGAPVTPWYRKVALVIVFPFVLPTIPLVFAILLAFGLYAVIHNFVSELLFRARMRQCARFLRWPRLSVRIAHEGSAILIIDSPSRGSELTHA